MTPAPIRRSAARRRRWWKRPCARVASMHLQGRQRLLAAALMLATLINHPLQTIGGWLYFDHGQLQRAIAKNLHHQGTIEFDVRLHQHRSCGHLTQQMAHGLWVCAGFGIGRTAFEHLLPHIGELHQHATHGQTIEQKFMQLRHQAIFFKPALKRFLLVT